MFINNKDSAEWQAELQFAFPGVDEKHLLDTDYAVAM